MQVAKPVEKNNNFKQSASAEKVGADSSASRSSPKSEKLPNGTAPTGDGKSWAEKKKQRGEEREKQRLAKVHDVSNMFKIFNVHFLIQFILL